MVARAEAGDPGGSLVGVASLAALEATPRQYSYAASKAALVAMIKGMAVELARYGIRANTIAPGWIATDMTAGMQDNPKFAEKVLPRVPARRWGEVEDFGGAAVYLASRASSYHTADTLVIDGGYAVF
jgi:NAD(P)-dependent dehydrogenase (short-subunit alcohol dehydrogenase family)